VRVSFGEDEDKVRLTGEVYDGLGIRQGFVARTSRLVSVELYLATYKRQNKGILHLELFDTTNKRLCGTHVEVSKLDDNSFREFGLDAELLPGREYEIRIRTSHCRLGSSVTAAYVPISEGTHFFIGARLMGVKQLRCVFNYKGEVREDASVKPWGEPGERPPVPDELVPGLISIVIPHYNCQDYLVKCLASIARQTYSCVQVVVVDDCSKEKTAKGIVKSFSGMFPVEFMQRRKNGGAPSARNAGAGKALGEYLFFCDADVELYPNALEVLMRKLLKNPNADFCYGGFSWGPQTVLPRVWDKDELYRKNYVTTMSLMRKSVFPGWDESLQRHQDWDMWLTIVDNGSIGVCCNKYLFKTPARADGISTNANIDMMESRDIVARKHQKKE
jgi:hypothetical protein